MRILMMGLLLILLTLTTSYANPISEVSRGRAKADLQKELERIFGGNYSSILRQLNKGMNDYDYLASLPESAASNKTLKELKRIFYPQFSSIRRQYDKNMAAYNELNN